jgi:hypothetical protein
LEAGVAGVQEFRSSGVQEFRSSGVQEFRSSGVQESLYISTRIRKNGKASQANPYDSSRERTPALRMLQLLNSF